MNWDRQIHHDTQKNSLEVIIKFANNFIGRKRKGK